MLVGLDPLYQQVVAHLCVREELRSVLLGILLSDFNDLCSLSFPGLPVLLPFLST